MFLNVIVDFESSDLCCKVTFLVWNEAAAKLARYLSNSTPTARPFPPHNSSFQCNSHCLQSDIRLMSLLKSVHCVLQPHPASEAAAATVVASGAQTTIKLPRAIVDDDLTDGADTYVDSWQDEPLSPVTTVYGAAPPPPLARQQTFGRVSAFCSSGFCGIRLAMLHQHCRSYTKAGPPASVSPLRTLHVAARCHSLVIHRKPASHSRTDDMHKSERAKVHIAGVWASPCVSHGSFPSSCWSG